MTHSYLITCQTTRTVFPRCQRLYVLQHLKRCLTFLSLGCHKSSGAEKFPPGRGPPFFCHFASWDTHGTPMGHQENPDVCWKTITCDFWASKRVRKLGWQIKDIFLVVWNGNQSINQSKVEIQVTMGSASLMNKVPIFHHMGCYGKYLAQHWYQLWFTHALWNANMFACVADNSLNKKIRIVQQVLACDNTIIIYRNLVGGWRHRPESFELLGRMVI